MSCKKVNLNKNSKIKRYKYSISVIIYSFAIYGNTYLHFLNIKKLVDY